MTDMLTKNESTLLLWLYEHKEGKMTHIMKQSSLGQGALYNSANTLKERGLIDERIGEDNRSRYLFITTKGEKVGDALKKFLETLA